MNIIENNYKNEYPKTVTCQNCNSIIELESENDTRQIVKKQPNNILIEHHFRVFTCPCCKKDSRI